MPFGRVRERVTVSLRTDRNSQAPARTIGGMDLSGKRVLVTGGAGLIGPPLAGELARDNDVVVADDLSKGRRERIPDDAAFVEADLTDPDDVAAAVTPDLDCVFHLAAHTDTNHDDPRELYEENTAMTYNLLERMAEVDVRNLAFTSSSTVYGEAPRPTPEDYAPLEPISVYGASKLADEALLSTYAHSHDFQTWCFRFANIVGPGQRGTVIPDFVEKLRDDPETLTILGDGRQEKSYLHVTDCVDAMCHVVEHADGATNTYNLGTRTTTSVNAIADVVSDELGLDPTYEYTGGDRGWTGDVPKMRLSIEKLSALGWEPPASSDEAVRRAARELAAELT
jgi:UDP-glucose 4-epimerase